MLGRLLLLFTVVPIVELYLLITLGGVIGTAATVGIVLATGLLGATLARHEGSRVLRAWQAAMARGEIPEEGVVSSLLVLVGGVLLVTPGVLTDVVGLGLLVPPTRRAVARMIQRRVAHRFEITTIGGALGPDPFGQRPQGDVIDLGPDEVREDPEPEPEPEPRPASADR